MNSLESPEESTDDDGPDSFSLKISALIILAFVVLWIVSAAAPSPGLTVAFLLAEVAVISIVIWQACDPFADAAQWIGEKLNLPGSVRGATLDAIASSMPELFSGIFFVVIAVSSASSGSEADIIAAGAEGYGSTIATCAGSAVYNMILIPAFCALVISFYRKSRPTIDVEDEVIARDGLWFVSCELLLILFLFQNQMHWWMGVVFLVLYVLYIFQLYRDAVIFRKRKKSIEEFLPTFEGERTSEAVFQAMSSAGNQIPKAIIMQVLENSSDDEDEEEETDSAGVFFGYWDVALNSASAWGVIIISTIVAAAACYFLVEATLETSVQLGVPAFFVAVILAAAASSVPDTFLAIGAAQRGDDSGAVSNAFGSNIFDICICLSIPLFVNSYLTGWAPVSLLQDGEPIPGLMGLRILLVALTIITLMVMWHNRQLTRNKALGLCGLYMVFIAYAVLGSLGVLF